jgi:hypothetical protein
MDLQEVGWERFMDWIYLAVIRDRCSALLNTIMNLWFP